MSPGEDLIGACAELRAASRRWLALSLLVLVLAGLFALALLGISRRKSSKPG